MRYIQHEDKPVKEPKKEKPAIKAGSKDYDYSNLSGGRKIPTKGGFK